MRVRRSDLHSTREALKLNMKFALPALYWLLALPVSADELQLNPQDAALRALAYDMQRCGWKRENISATLKFYLPGGDAAIRRFWVRVDTDTHRPWFSCEAQQ